MFYRLTNVSKSIASRHLKEFRLRTGKPYRSGAGELLKAGLAPF